MNQLDCTKRFWAVIAGQAAGVFLLFVVRFPIPIEGANQASIIIGLNNIDWAMIVTLAVLLLGLFLAFVPLIAKPLLSPFDRHDHVDYILWIFLGTDLLALLFLVCQQGGLCYSFFFPIFFLIPAGYIAVERHDKLKRVLTLIIVIFGCFFISSKAEGILEVPILSIPVTNFQTLVHQGYHKALLIVSGVSVLIPLLQVGITTGTLRIRKGTTQGP